MSPRVLRPAAHDENSEAGGRACRGEGGGREGGVYGIMGLWVYGIMGLWVYGIISRNCRTLPPGGRVYSGWH